LRMYQKNMDYEPHGEGAKGGEEGRRGRSAGPEKGSGPEIQFSEIWLGSSNL